MDIKYAVNFITDLAALLLECRVSGSINLCELLEGTVTSISNIQVTATPEEHELINNTFADFASNPLTYDLSEMCLEEEMLEMAELCKELRQELYE